MQNINKIFKKSLTLLLFCFPFYLQAQILSGTVLDDVTNKPIEGIFVYLEGTSISSITNSEGKFHLSVSKKINTSLMFYNLSYFPVQILNPYEENIDKIYMKQKAHDIKEVIIENFYFTKEQKMKAFKEQLLGNTKAGKSCSILNEDDIELFYDLSSKTLTASAEKPIIISNKYLAYEIKFIMNDFMTEYSRDKTLKNDAVVKNSFKGSFLFTDLYSPETVPVKIKKARNKVYKSSSSYFFKSLATNKLKEDRYKIYTMTIPLFSINASRPINPYDYFAIQDTLSCKLLTIIPGTNIEKAYGGDCKKIDVVYNRDLETQSGIYFFTDSVLIDSYGNIDATDKVFFSGYMGQNKTGNLLPLDYQP